VVSYESQSIVGNRFFLVTGKANMSKLREPNKNFVDIDPALE
jgi:hypothetical protein